MTVRRAFGTWIAAVVLAAVGLAVGVLLLANPLGLGGHGLGDAQASLQSSIPAANDASGRFVGFSRWDASALNRARSASTIHYVPASAASTGPNVVSVHVIDDYSWAAAALSTDDGRCYVILVTVDSNDSRYGYSTFGVLPKGTPCLGSAASSVTATTSSWPHT